MRRMTYLFLMVLACMIVFTEAVPAFAANVQNLVTISTDVTGPDGEPIVGASVDMDLLKGQTYADITEFVVDAGGTVDFVGKAGTYQVGVTAPNADPVSEVVTLTKGQTLGLDFELQTYGAISGTIADLSTSAPIPAAIVEFYLRNGDGSWPTVPTASVVATDGAYVSGPLVTGEYKVTAHATGYTVGFFDDFGLGEPTPVTVVYDVTKTGVDITLAPLNPAGIIEGHVTGGTPAQPIGSAFVWIYKQNADGSWPPTSPGWGSPTRTVYTDNTGYYASGELPYGNYKVRFFTIHTGSRWYDGVLTFDAATVLTIDTPGQVLSGIDCWFPTP